MTILTLMLLHLTCLSVLNTVTMRHIAFGLIIGAVYVSTISVNSCDEA